MRNYVQSITALLWQQTMRRNGGGPHLVAGGAIIVLAACALHSTQDLLEGLASRRGTLGVTAGSDMSQSSGLGLGLRALMQVSSFEAVVLQHDAMHSPSVSAG